MRKFVKFAALLLLLCFIVDCKKDLSPIPQAPTTDYVNYEGSDMRFVITGKIMFTLGGSGVRVYDISIPENPGFIGISSLNISGPPFYAKGDTLFVGTNNGISIFNISDPLNPVLLSTPKVDGYTYPIVFNRRYAYLALRSYYDNSYYKYGINQLWSMDLSNLSNPVLADTIATSYATGLSLVKNDLLVSDNGLKIFDGASLPTFKLKKYIKTGYLPSELWPYDNNVLINGNDGLYQYKYDNDSLTLLSKIAKQ